MPSSPSSAPLSLNLIRAPHPPSPKLPPPRFPTPPGSFPTRTPLPVPRRRYKRSASLLEASSGQGQIFFSKTPAALAWTSRQCWIRERRCWIRGRRCWIRGWWRQLQGDGRPVRATPQAGLQRRRPAMALDPRPHVQREGPLRPYRRLKEERAGDASECLVPAMALTDDHHEYAKLVRGMNPPRVVIDNDASDDATVIRVDSVNNHGTLLAVVQVIADLNIVIRKAYFSSDGSWFMDVFNVTDRAGNKVLDKQTISYIQKEEKLHREEKKRPARQSKDER